MRKVAVTRFAHRSAIEVLLVVLSSSAMAAAIAAEPPQGRQSAPAAAAKVDYASTVHPLLMRRCARCHGETRHESGLRLDSASFILKGGDGGPVIAPGHSSTSRLIERVSAPAETRMPPEGEPLAAPEIALLRAWIDDGAPGAKNEPAPGAQKHWAFERPRQAAVPAIQSGSNPIDAFVEARLQSEKLQPVAAAPPNVWLRRVTLDLTGLPPTVAELRAFLDDSSPDSRAHVVERLLASPAYGERWGRHWMDVWRYSDWYGWGEELRNSARHIWRWRDWIIESLNADVPYNEMLIEMLAADELYPDDPDRIRATGFLARNYSRYNRDGWLDETVEHTSKAFLAITLNCARCHNHRYDPIPQTEYYAFRAIFEPYRVRDDRVSGQLDVMRDGLSRVYDADLDKPTFLYVRGSEKNPDRSHRIAPAVPAALHGTKFDVHAVRLPLTASHPGLQAFCQRDEVAAARAACDRAASALSEAAKRSDAALCEVRRLQLAAAKAALTSLEARIEAEKTICSEPVSPDARSVRVAAARAERLAEVAAAKASLAEIKFADRERSKKSNSKGAPASAKGHAIGDLAAAEKRLAAARDKANEVSDRFTPVGASFPSTSTGRRLALARWIASNENPLTARVAVNHIWLRHFGQPLVATVFDFGEHGKSPTHPELLDWLAVELMRSGWQMKRIHRLIVLSETYARDSAHYAPGSVAARVDADNHFLWRMNARRLESEGVRDSVLAAADRLDQRMRGPELDSGLGERTCRRSVYYRHAPEKFMTFLQSFDAPSPIECYRRNSTVVPQQALALSNSTLVREQARVLARALSSPDSDRRPERQSDSAYVDVLFERVLSRHPSVAERKECCAFLSRQAQLLGDAQHLTAFTGGNRSSPHGSTDRVRRAREDLAHVLFNHTEFVTIR